MIEALAIVFIRAVILVAVLAAVSAGLLRWLAPHLTARQGFLMSLVAFAVAMACILVFSITRPFLGIPPEAETLAVIIATCLAGTLVTRQARRHGVQKTGWLVWVQNSC